MANARDTRGLTARRTLHDALIALSLRLGRSKAVPTEPLRLALANDPDFSRMVRRYRGGPERLTAALPALALLVELYGKGSWASIRNAHSKGVRTPLTPRRLRAIERALGRAEAVFAAARMSLDRAHGGWTGNPAAMLFLAAHSTDPSGPIDLRRWLLELRRLRERARDWAAQMGPGIGRKVPLRREFALEVARVLVQHGFPLRNSDGSIFARVLHVALLLADDPLTRTGRTFESLVADTVAPFRRR